MRIMAGKKKPSQGIALAALLLNILIMPGLVTGIQLIKEAE